MTNYQLVNRTATIQITDASLSLRLGIIGGISCSIKSYDQCQSYVDQMACFQLYWK